eukprot:3630326-Prymnesium_polylepis.1
MRVCCAQPARYFSSHTAPKRWRARRQTLALHLRCDASAALNAAAIRRRMSMRVPSLILSTARRRHVPERKSSVCLNTEAGSARALRYQSAPLHTRTAISWRWKDSCRSPKNAQRSRYK